MPFFVNGLRNDVQAQGPLRYSTILAMDDTANVTSSRSGPPVLILILVMVISLFWGCFFASVHDRSETQAFVVVTKPILDHTVTWVPPSHRKIPDTRPGTYFTWPRAMAIGTARSFEKEQSREFEPSPFVHPTNTSSRKEAASTPNRDSQHLLSTMATVISATGFGVALSFPKLRRGAAVGTRWFRRSARRPLKIFKVCSSVFDHQGAPTNFQPPLIKPYKVALITLYWIITCYFVMHTCIVDSDQLKALWNNAPQVRAKCPIEQTPQPPPRERQPHNPQGPSFLEVCNFAMYPLAR